MCEYIKANGQKCGNKGRCPSHDHLMKKSREVKPHGFWRSTLSSAFGNVIGQIALVLLILVVGAMFPNNPQVRYVLNLRPPYSDSTPTGAPNWTPPPATGLTVHVGPPSKVPTCCTTNPSPQAPSAPVLNPAIVADTQSSGPAVAQILPLDSSGNLKDTAWGVDPNRLTETLTTNAEVTAILAHPSLIGSNSTLGVDPSGTFSTQSGSLQTFVGTNPSLQESMDALNKTLVNTGIAADKILGITSPIQSNTPDFQKLISDAANTLPSNGLMVLGADGRLKPLGTDPSAILTMPVSSNDNLGVRTITPASWQIPTAIPPDTLKAYVQ